MKKNTLFIIDGSSYIFRAFFAIPRLSNSQGFPTNAVYGFVNMLVRALDELDGGKLVMVFDTPAPSFRKELYTEYKSNREAPPEDLVRQFPYIFQSVDAFQISRLSREGFEADDVIATLVKRAVEDGFAVEIITGDKDLMQLIGNSVSVYDAMNEKRYDASAVFEKFEVYPSQIADYLALMGDSSDNIPGVSGIGKKTAAELLKQFKSLDGIYENLDQIKQEKRRQTLAAEKEMAYLSRKLVTLKDDLDVAFQWTDFDYSGPDKVKLQLLFEELEFDNLLKRFQLQASALVSEFQKAAPLIIRSVEGLEECLRELENRDLISVDTETTSLSPHDAELVGISLSAAANESFYIPLNHVSESKGPRVANQPEPERVRRALKPFLEHPEIKKVGQNLKFDIQVLRKWGVRLDGIDSDTLVASYLIDPDQKHNLDALSHRYLKHRTTTYEEVVGKGKSERSFAEVGIEQAADYSGEDAQVAFCLHQKLMPELESLGLTELFRNIEVPLVSILADMEYVGALVDREHLAAMSKALTLDTDLLQEEIFRLAGETFNISSPKQLSRILFDKLRLPVVKKTKTGLSTDESVLLKYAKDYEVCRKILDFRGLQKLYSTYAEGLLNQIHPATGRIHTHYNQTVTATGRLSSSSPNLQNIPVGGDVKYDIRSSFIAEAGCTLVCADYSQVELRLLADMSGDEALLEAFRNDEDVHASTAKLIFGSSSVTSEQRRVAKTINFGVIYGQTPYGLSQTLGISTTEAKQFIDTYFAKYSRVQAFLRQLIEQARSHGYAVTQLGRRRKVPEISSSNRIRREMAERVAINTPIQGTAADLIKIAMINVYRSLRKQKLASRLILQVHDELVLEVPDTEKSIVDKILKSEMEQALQLKVPLKASLGSGKNWSECK